MATRVLAALIVLAYAASALVGGAWWDLPAETLLRSGGAYGPAIAGGERWRLASAIFLHGGLPHLAFNLLALLDFGTVLERRFGALRVIAVFFAAGIAGFVLSTFWHPDAVSIGASGAIFGLLGWWAVAAWRFGEFLPATERRRRLTTLLVVVGVALGLGFAIPGVDNAAHLGGLLAGLGLGFLATRRPSPVPAAAALLAAGALAATLALPDELARRHHEGRDFGERYAAFAREDRAISAALLALGEASRQGRLSDAEGLTRLERDLLPRLERLAAALAGQAYMDARIEAERVRWAQYAALRRDAVAAIGDAARGRRPDGVAVFERKMAEAASIARGAEPTDRR